ncbi:hypothetical protein EYZ11_009516 [Aspergillus tanneri]|uniref:Tat pathway signal sequence n=1 Tax=Aspergillus tanneri TaxID=1220188 RepID=A0A4V3UNG3_9EURO|nr:hypothetical protein EYZ11_009516 [Aspergillus tanneri]
MVHLNRLQLLSWVKRPTPYLHVSDKSREPSKEHEPFKDGGSQDNLLEGYPYGLAPHRHLRWWQKGRWLIMGHVILFAIYGAVLAAVAKNGLDPRRNGLPLSPAVTAVQWENHKFSLEDHITEDGRFVGKPSPALDKAWHDLLNAENIIIEPEYIEHLGRENLGVAVPEGGGYLGTLNVYHELHCLKRIHQYMYPDYYFPEFTEKQDDMNRMHNEHCIDFLRQSAMCHGDIGLITYQWSPGSLLPIANATSHQCVNWERLDQWTKSRTVDMLKPGWLVHPIHGA